MSLDALTVAVDAARSTEAERRERRAADERSRSEYFARRGAERKAVDDLIDGLRPGSPSEDVAAVIRAALDHYNHPQGGMLRRGVAARIADKIGMPAGAIIAIMDPG